MLIISMSCCVFYNLIALHVGVSKKTISLDFGEANNRLLILNIRAQRKEIVLHFCFKGHQHGMQLQSSKFLINFSWDFFFFSTFKGIFSQYPHAY